jgi:hypothetical protein
MSFYTHAKLASVPSPTERSGSRVKSLLTAAKSVAFFTITDLNTDFRVDPPRRDSGDTRSPRKTKLVEPPNTRVRDAQANSVLAIAFWVSVAIRCISSSLSGAIVELSIQKLDHDIYACM